MKNTFTWLVLAVIIIVVIVLATGNKKDAPAPGASIEDPIVLGFTGPITGDLANVGENALAAVELAVEEVNAEGGINGRTLEVIYEDDQCTGTAGASAINKLVNVDGVSALVSSVCSPVVLSVAPIVESAQIPMLAYCSTAADISQAGDFVFRTVPSDLFQAAFGADYAYNELDAETAAVVYINNDWGVGLRTSFIEEFEAFGGEIVTDEAYDPATVDLRSQMSKVREAQPDIVYFAGFTDGTIAGIRQAKELGVEVPFLGADAWDDTRVWSELGEIADGVMYSVIATEDNQAFRTAMAEKVGSEEVIFCSNFAYDNVKILAQVIEEVGDDPLAIKDALYGVKYRNGVSSKTIEFDENGDPLVAEYVVKVVQDGKASLME